MFPCRRLSFTTSTVKASRRRRPTPTDKQARQGRQRRRSSDPISGTFAFSLTPADRELMGTNFADVISRPFRFLSSVLLSLFVFPRHPSCSMEVMSFSRPQHTQEHPRDLLSCLSFEIPRSTSLFFPSCCHTSKSLGHSQKKKLG